MDDGTIELISLHEQLAALENCAAILAPWNTFQDLSRSIKVHIDEIESIINGLEKGDR